MSTHGKHDCDGISTREVPDPRGEDFEPFRTMYVSVEGEEYEVCVPPQANCTLSGLRVEHLLRLWASKHYKLSRRQQRLYLARSIGVSFELLLVKAKLGTIPNNLNDIICLLTIAMRRMSEEGDPVELNKPASRRRVFQEIQRLLDLKRNEISRTAEEVTATKSLLTAVKTRSKIVQETAETPDFTVTAEEVTNLNYLLNRTSNLMTQYIIASCMAMLQQAEEDFHPAEHPELLAADVNPVKGPIVKKGFPTFSCGQSFFCQGAPDTEELVREASSID